MLNGEKERGGQRLSMHYHHRMTQSTCATLLWMVSYLPGGHNFIIRADFYFGAFDAATSLDAQGYRFTLSCRKDRPSQLFGRFLHTCNTLPNTCTTLYRHSSTTQRTMAAIKFWHQKTEGEKVVNFLSNIFVGKGTLRRKNEQIVDIALNYNTHMSYVDQVNVACQLFSYPHKLINGKHAVFFWLVEATIHNCCVMWGHLHSLRKESFGTFQRELADELQQEGMGLQHCHHYLVSGKRKKCAVCHKCNINSNTTLSGLSYLQSSSSS